MGLAAIMRVESANDERMTELHILQEVLAVEHGEASLEEMLRQEGAG